MSDVYGIEIEQGETFQLRFTVINDAGLPVYPNTISIAMQIRASQDPASTLIATGTVTYNAATGDIDVVIPYATTAGMSFASAYYTVQVTNGSQKDRIAQGPVTLNKGVVP